MNAAMDELVEKAARELFERHPVARGMLPWDELADDNRVKRITREDATAVLEAIGLPALLERVEAALAIHERRTPDAWTGTASSSPPFDRDYCPRCRVNWPCATYRAALGDTP